MKISFNEKSHRYKINDEYVPSVTSIIGIIHKEELFQWAIHHPEAYIRETQEKSVTIGSQVHEAIMKILKNERVEITTDYPTEVQTGINAFLKWQKESGLTAIDTECLVASEKFKFAGRFDCLGKIGNLLTLCEWKTSKAIYPESYLQVCAYKIAYEEINQTQIEQMLIGRFDKETGLPEIKFFKGNDDYTNVFLSCLAIYNWKKEMRKKENTK